MEENKTETNNLTSLVITTLSIIVIVLSGVIGYVYYTKDITPKNTLVKLFFPATISFKDLPPSEQHKYILRVSPLEVLEVNEDEFKSDKQNEVIQDIVEESPKKEVSNRFLQKMAKMQKETDEMLIENKTAAIEDETSNRFLKKMAKMQKETDEMLIENNKPKKKQVSRAEELLKKTAKMQKDTDEMIIQNNGL